MREVGWARGGGGQQGMVGTVGNLRMQAPTKDNSNHADPTCMPAKCRELGQEQGHIPGWVTYGYVLQYPCLTDIIDEDSVLTKVRILDIQCVTKKRVSCLPHAESN